MIQSTHKRHCKLSSLSYDDLSIEQAVSLGIAAISYGSSNLTCATLPGNTGTLSWDTYWVINQERLVDYMMATYGINIAKQNQDPTSDKLLSLTAQLSPGTIAIGDTATLTVSGKHADGSTRSHSVSSCSVSVSDTSVVSVSGSAVKGLSSGTAMITVTKNGVSISVTITVN